MLWRINFDLMYSSFLDSDYFFSIWCKLVNSPLLVMQINKGLKFKPGRQR